jgi:hypothetical protein
MLRCRQELAVELASKAMKLKIAGAHDLPQFVSPTHSVVVSY